VLTTDESIPPDIPTTNDLGLNEVFEDFEILSIVGTTFFGFLGFGLYLALKSLEKDID